LLVVQYWCAIDTLRDNAYSLFLVIFNSSADVSSTDAVLSDVLLFYVFATALTFFTQ